METLTEFYNRIEQNQQSRLGNCAPEEREALQRAITVSEALNKAINTLNLRHEANRRAHCISNPQTLSCKDFPND